MFPLLVFQLNFLRFLISHGHASHFSYLALLTVVFRDAYEYVELTNNIQFWGFAEAPTSCMFGRTTVE